MCPKRQLDTGTATDGANPSPLPSSSEIPNDQVGATAESHGSVAPVFVAVHQYPNIAPTAPAAPTRLIATEYVAPGASNEDLRVIKNFKRFKRSGSSSKYKGVFYVTKEKKWRAQICLRGKKTYVGTFTNDLDAALARDKKVRALYGEFDELLNFQAHPTFVPLPMNSSSQMSQPVNPYPQEPVPSVVRPPPSLLPTYVAVPVQQVFQVGRIVSAPAPTVGTLSVGIGAAAHQTVPISSSSTSHDTTPQLQPISIFDKDNAKQENDMKSCNSMKKHENPLTDSS